MQKKTDRYLDAEGKHFKFTSTLLNLDYSDRTSYKLG